MASTNDREFGADHGPLLNVINWILLVATCILCLLKVVSKWVMVHQTQADDLCMIVAMLGAVGYGIAVSYEVSAGLGRGSTFLEIGNLDRFEHAYFTAQLFYIFSLCLGKLALLVFMLNFALRKVRRRVLKGLMWLNIVWLVVGILAVAFQCDLPRTWAVVTGKCFDQTTFWTYIGVTDILLDLATAIVPIYLLHDLQMKTRRKIYIVAIFASRTLLIPIIAVRLAFIHQSQSQSQSPSPQTPRSHGSHHLADSFRIAIVTIAHTNLNVIVTCFSFIKPVTEGLQTGILAGGLPRSTTTAAAAAVTPRYRMEHFGKGSSGDVAKGRRMLFASSRDSGDEDDGRRMSAGGSRERMVGGEGGGGEGV